MKTLLRLAPLAALALLAACETPGRAPLLNDHSAATGTKSSDVSLPRDR